jgi:hypothetical protein
VDHFHWYFSYYLFKQDCSLGAILYLFMDIILHWGVLRHLRNTIKAKRYIVITAIVFDAAVLSAFLWVKAATDIVVIAVSFIMIVLIIVGEKFFLQSLRSKIEGAD